MYLGELLLIISFVIFLIYKCFQTLNKQRGIMSEITFKFQKQLIVSLIFQFMIPSSTLFLPFILVASLATLEVPNITCTLFNILAFLNIIVPLGIYQGLVLIGTLHSFSNTLMMIVTIKPYRVAVIRFFKKRTFYNADNSTNHGLSRIATLS